MDNEPAHRVTISDLYEQGRQTLAELREVNIRLATLEVREDERKEDIAELREHQERFDSAISWLQRTVYAVGLPLVALLGGYEAVTKLWL